MDRPGPPKTRAESTYADADWREPTLDALEYAHDSLVASERVQGLWADSLRRLVNACPATLDQEIDRVLVRAGRFAEADRCYLFQHSADGRTLVVSHEWVAPGSQSQSDALAQIDATVLPEFLRRLQAGDEVYVPDVNELGEPSRIERVVLASHGVASTLLVPMIARDEFIGFVGFDSTERIRYWTTEHRATLRFVADLIGGAVVRGRLERESNVLMRALEQSPTGVAIFSHDGSAEWLNAAYERMSGHTYEQLVDRATAARPFGIGDGDLLNAMLGVVLAGGVWEHELVMPNALGSEVAVYLTMFEVEEPDRTENRIVCLVDDVTETVQTRRQLERAKTTAERTSRGQGRLLTTLGSEMKAPIDALSAELHSLAAADDAEMQATLIASLTGRVDALAEVLDGVLTLSRLEAGEIEVAEEPVDVRALVGEVAEWAGRDRSPDGPLVRTRVREDVPPTVIADATLLKQVLQDLASNAVEFTPHGLIELSVTVRSSTDGDQLVFRVADTGVGIDPERLERIFDPDDDAEGGRGSGLGLTITRERTEMMGGSISVDSQVGSGTTFTVALPLREEAGHFEPARTSTDDAEQARQLTLAESVPPSDDPAPRTEAPRGIRVLVADDSDDSVRVVAAFLRPVAETIDAVGTGLEALERVRADVYDLVLMGMQMPVMDGYAATAAIRSLDDVSAADTPIVALTTYALAEEIGRAISAGCDGYLTKPIRRAELMRTVEKYARAPRPSA